MKETRERGGREEGREGGRRERAHGVTNLAAVVTSSRRGCRSLTASRRKRRAGEAESSSSGSAGMAARAQTRAWGRMEGRREGEGGRRGGRKGLVVHKDIILIFIYQGTL